MTTIDNGRGRTIDIDPVDPYSRWTTLTVTNTTSGRFIVAGLRPEHRKALADVLDPDRGTYPSGSQADTLARERDEAIARAAAAERERDALDDRLAQVDMELSQAVAAPVVSRADIEKAIQPYVWPQHLDGATDEIWALLDERAEQPVDPVEELAEELYDVAHGKETYVAWNSITESGREYYRRIARHVRDKEDRS